jgi:hypothetical protein
MDVLVDSSLFKPGPEGTTVSIPENGNIAVEAAKAAESVLASHSYKVHTPVLVSVGARFDPGRKIRVQTPSGFIESPQNLDKPFVVWPAADAALKSRVNQLFRWVDRQEKRPPDGSLDVFSSAGLLLLSCSGSRAEATARVQFLVVDRSSGKIVWEGRGTTADVTPEGVAKTARQLLADLP